MSFSQTSKLAGGLSCAAVWVRFGLYFLDVAVGICCSEWSIPELAHRGPGLCTAARVMDGQQPLDEGDIAAAIGVGDPRFPDSEDLEDLGFSTDESGAENDTESSGEELFYSDAQRQWDANLKELEVALFMVLCPVIGRLLGRRTAQRLWVGYVRRRYEKYVASGAEF